MEMQIPQLRQLFEARVGQISSVLAKDPPAELGKIDPMMRGLKGFMFALEGMLRKNELQHMPFTARVDLFNRVGEAIETLKAMPDSLDGKQALGVLRVMDGLHRLCLHENLMASGLDASKLGKLTVILERKFGEVLGTIDKVAETGQAHTGQIEQATQERLAEIEEAYQLQAKILASNASTAVESIHSQAKTIQQQQAEAMKKVEAFQGELRRKLQQCQAALDEQLDATGAKAAEIRGEQKAVTNLLARAREQVDSMQATIQAMAETAEATDIARGDLQAKLSEGRDVIGSMHKLLETSKQGAGQITANVTPAQQGLESIQQLADEGLKLFERVAEEQAQSVAAIRETAQSVTAARETAASAETLLRDARQSLDLQFEDAKGVLSEIQAHGKNVDDAAEQALQQQQAAGESLRQAEEDLTQFHAMFARGRQAAEQLEKLAQAGDDLKLRVGQTFDHVCQNAEQIKEEAKRLHGQFEQSLSENREAALDAVVALRADQAAGADLLGQTRQDVEALAGEISRIGELRTAAVDTEREICERLDKANDAVAELEAVLNASGKVKSQIEGQLNESTSMHVSMENMVCETAEATENSRLQQDQALSTVRGEIEAIKVQRKTLETAFEEQFNAANDLVADLRARKKNIDALLVETRQHCDAARVASQATGEARVAIAEATGEVQAILQEARRAAVDIAGLLAAGAKSRSQIDAEVAAMAEVAVQVDEIRRELGEFLDQARQSTKEMNATSGQSQQLITDLRASGQGALAALTQQNTELTAQGEKVQQKLEDLFGTAADGGLYRQFDELAQQSVPRGKKWLRLMIVSGAGGGLLLATISSLLTVFSGWAAGATLVAGLVPLIFFMHLCVSQYSAERRSESKHQYQATVGRSLAAYRKLLSTMRSEGIADSAYVDRMLSALFGVSTESAVDASVEKVSEDD